MIQDRRVRSFGCLIAFVFSFAVLALGISTILNPTFWAKPHSPTTEAKANLRALYAAQLAAPQFAESMESLGPRIEVGNRYVYIINPAGDLLLPGFPDGGVHTGLSADSVRHPSIDSARLRAGIPPSVLVRAGLKCQSDGGCDITMLAAGDIDSDPTIDVWSVSTAPRDLPDGGHYPPGVPLHEVDDLEN